MILEDTFPATVVIATPDFELPAAELKSRPPTPGLAHFPITRVVVSGTEVIVLIDSPGGPEKVFEDTIDPSTHYKGSTHLDSHVTTTSGVKIAWRKDTMCGCGSRLRSYRPFKSMGSSRDPLS